MGTEEFSIYVRRVFDTQEGICHLGEKVKPIILSGDEKDEESA